MPSDVSRPARFMVTAATATLLVLAPLTSLPVAAQVEWPGEGAVTLGEARSGHTATRLDDDYVLVAGGTDGDTVLASVEIVDPVGMAVETLGPLLVARSEHTATPLPDGRLLIAGGRSADVSLAEAELYDPVSGESQPTGPLRWARAGHEAVPLDDGRVLLVGGVDGETPVVGAELYDPSAGTFSQAAMPRAAHSGAVATLLADGRVLLVGEVVKAARTKDATNEASKKKSRKERKKAEQQQKARQKKGKPTAQAPAKAWPLEIYDAASDTWSPVEGVEGLAGRQPGLLSDGRVLLAGGSDVSAWLLDPASGEVTESGALPRPRDGSTVTPLADGRLLIAGGADAGFELAGLEVFDPRSEAFESAGEMLIPRIGHTATSLSDGRVLITGGSFAALALDDLLVYDIESDALLSLSIDLEVAVEPGSVGADTRVAADIRARFGPPEAFAIYYYDAEAEDGSATPASTETWTYFGSGVEFTFEDDRVVAEDAVDVRPVAEIVPVPYDPDQFSAYMPVDEVLAVTGIDEYLSGPADEVIENAQLYFGPQLTWAMLDGQLRYVEALALEVDDASGEVR